MYGVQIRADDLSKLRQQLRRAHDAAGRILQHLLHGQRCHGLVITVLLLLPDLSPGPLAFCHPRNEWLPLLRPQSPSPTV